MGNLLRRCENKIFISDNPGHNFTINKIRDSASNTTMWGYTYVDQ